MTEEKITSKNTGDKNKTWSVDDEHIRRTSAYIRHTLKGRVLYHIMMSLMFIESIIWELMDLVRAARMKIAAIISKNNHIDRV